MSDRNTLREVNADQALRSGLEALPLPRLSADFEENVLAGLRTPLPWWRRLTIPALWTELRPVAAGGACAVVLTLGLYVWASRLPLETPAQPVPRGAQSVVLERQLRGLDLGDATLGFFPGGAFNLLPRPPRQTAPTLHRSLERSSVPSTAFLFTRAS